MYAYTYNYYIRNFIFLLLLYYIAASTYAASPGWGDADDTGGSSSSTASRATTTPKCWNTSCHKKGWRYDLTATEIQGVCVCVRVSVYVCVCLCMCVCVCVRMCMYHISSINTIFSISTPARYCLTTNNIDIVIIFISSAPSSSTACHFVTPCITANHCVTMITLLIVFKF